MSEHVPVVVVGAGQAGLSLSWHLTRRGVEHVLLERDTVAHEWRDGRWDAFTLVTPNRQCQLPGWGYTGPEPDGFMARDEVHAFVRAYAASFGAPVREGVEVTGLEQRDGGGFALSTTAGAMTADQVVLATGGYHRPVVPAWADRLPDDVTAVHSSRYRSPGQLPPGAVLVVGTGQSGAQIAEDLHLAGRRVHLAVGSAPRVARRYRGRDCMTWLSDMGVYDRPAATRPGGAAALEKTNHYVTGRGGGRDVDLRAFALEGMRLHGRITGWAGPGGVLAVAPTLAASLDAADAVAESIKDDIDRHVERAGLDAPVEARYEPVWRPDAEPPTLDLRAEGVGAVVWATGYRPDHSWVDVGVFDGRGRPRQTRGATTAPGLSFLGLPWMHTWGSGRFAGIARDAEHLADVVGAGLVGSSDPAPALV